MREAICLVQLRKGKLELVGMARRSVRAAVRTAFLECGDLRTVADLSVNTKPNGAVENVSARARSRASTSSLLASVSLSDDTCQWHLWSARGLIGHPLNKRDSGSCRDQPI